MEFLRYLVYKTTNRSLLIKNAGTVAEIKTNAEANINIVGAIRKYKAKHGLHKLAEIFYRYKPLFLAFRSNSNMRPIINKIRKLAVKYHKAMRKDYLNDVTAMISRGEKINEKVLQTELSRVSIFRKVRLAQALSYRNNDEVTSILYKIRNGKSYATEFAAGNNKSSVQDTLEMVLDSIVGDVKKNVFGKKIYIPEYIEYAMPATEKQFTGDLPSGTCITVDRNMVFGVHWEDQGKQRIDLDLSLISANDAKIGWDASYRNRGRTALFSGDLTSAPLPRGASELFYLDEADESYYIMYINYFNFSESIPVPFKILVAKERVSSNFERGYMVNPNNVIGIAKTKLDVKQKMLGLVITTAENIKFYFNEAELGRGITSRGNQYTRHARKYLFDYASSTISLNDILVRAGAVLVDDNDEADIDLSPEALEKDTIISLLTQ